MTRPGVIKAQAHSFYLDIYLSKCTFSALPNISAQVWSMQEIAKLIWVVYNLEDQLYYFLHDIYYIMLSLLHFTLDLIYFTFKVTGLKVEFILPI